MELVGRRIQYGEPRTALRAVLGIARRGLFNGLRRSTPPALSCRRARKNKIVQSFIAQRPPSPQRSSFGRPRPAPIPLPDQPPNRRQRKNKNFIAQRPLPHIPIPRQLPCHHNPPPPSPESPRRFRRTTPSPSTLHHTHPRIPRSPKAASPPPATLFQLPRRKVRMSPRYPGGIRVHVQVARHPLEVATASYASLGPPLSPRSTPLLSSSNRQGGVQKS